MRVNNIDTSIADELPCSQVLIHNESGYQQPFPSVMAQVTNDAAMINQSLPSARRIAKAHNFYTVEFATLICPRRIRHKCNDVKSVSKTTTEFMYEARLGISTPAGIGRC